MGVTKRTVSIPLSASALEDEYRYEGNTAIALNKIREFAKQHPQQKMVINAVGYSRGAVTLLAIAKACAKDQALQNVKFNLY